MLQRSQRYATWLEESMVVMVVAEGGGVGAVGRRGGKDPDATYLQYTLKF